MVLLLLCKPVQSQNNIRYNTLQYQNYKWKLLKTDYYNIYFPVNYDSLASFASLHLPDIINTVKKDWSLSLKEAPDLLVYPSVQSLYQSNVGGQDTVLRQFPTVHVMGNRISLCFNGSYADFRADLKKAWVSACWESIIGDKGIWILGNTTPSINHAYKQGLIDYMSSGWRMADEIALQQRLSSVDTVAIHRYQALEPLMVKGMVYYLQQNYRSDVVKQLLWHLAKGKAWYRTLRLLTKKESTVLLKEFVAYYEERRLRETVQRPLSVTDSLLQHLTTYYKQPLTAIQWAKDSNRLYYITTVQHHKYLYTLSKDSIAYWKQRLDTINTPGYKGKKKKLWRPIYRYAMPPWYGQYDMDPYPLIDLSVSEKKSKQQQSTIIIVPIKGVLQALEINPKGKVLHTQKLYGLDGVHQFEKPSPTQLLMSAHRLGKSDLVIFDQQKLRYHLLSPAIGEHTTFIYDKQQQGLLYRSGFPQDSLWHKADSLYKPYGWYYRNVTNMNSRYRVEPEQVWSLDQGFSLPRYSNLKPYSFAGAKDSTVLLSLLNRAPSAAAWLQDEQIREQQADSINQLLARNKSTGNTSFLQKVLQQDATKTDEQDSLRLLMAYNTKKVHPYILQLHSLYFNTQLNNQYFINRYQPFQAYLGNFNFPKLSGMAMAGLSDIFENHHFQMGYRLPLTNTGSDFYVRYSNTKNRLDWDITFFRKVEDLPVAQHQGWVNDIGRPLPSVAKVKTYYYALGFNYPLDYYWSSAFQIAARNDRTVFLTVDPYSLPFKDIKSWWILLNNTWKTDQRYQDYKGLRRGYTLELSLDGMLSTAKPSTVLYGLQLKYQYNQPLLQAINVQLQSQLGYSGGQSHILYNFGGVDQNVNVQTDTAVAFSQQNNYAFQTLVTPFRGFVQNSIYGSSYALANIDIALPIFRTLFPISTRWNSIKSLELVFFADAVAVHQAVPIQTIVPQQNKTTLASLGTGIKTKIGNHPISFQIAWPATFDAKPVWTLSLSY
jgi:hypothetical protein